MPDGDVIYRTLVPCWRRPYRLIKGGADDTVILGSAVLKALAKNLRKAGGAPGLTDVAAIVAAVAGRQTDAPSALGELRAVERRERGHVHTRVLVQVGSRMVVELSHGGTAPLDLPVALAERFCAQLVDFNLFSRVTPSLVGTRFASHNKSASFQEQLMGAIGERLRKEARSLVRRPSGVSIRAPSVAGSRRPTAQTLYEPISL